MIVTSGFAFKYHKQLWGRIPRWERRLKGRSASVLSTMDSPPFFIKLHDRDPGGKMMNDVMRFTGMTFRRKHYFGSVVHSTESQRERWLADAYELGRSDSSPSHRA